MNVSTLLAYLQPILAASLSQLDPASRAAKLLSVAVQLLGLFAPHVSAINMTCTSNLNHPDVLKIADMMPAEMTHEKLLTLADRLPAVGKVA